MLEALNKITTVETKQGTVKYSCRLNPLYDWVNVPMMSKAYNVLPSTPSLWDFPPRMLTGDSFLFEQVIQEEDNLPYVVYAGMVDVCPAGLHCVVGGGIDGKIHVPSMLEYINNIGLHIAEVSDKFSFNTAPAIRLTGRIGWWKHLKGLGFTMVEKFESDNRKCAVFQKPIMCYEDEEMYGYEEEGEEGNKEKSFIFVA